MGRCKKIITAMIVFSIFIVALMWVPDIFPADKNSEPVIEKSVPSESLSSLRAPNPMLAPEKNAATGTDARELITWVIGTLNSVVLLVAGVKKILGGK